MGVELVFKGFDVRVDAVNMDYLILQQDLILLGALKWVDEAVRRCVFEYPYF